MSKTIDQNQNPMPQTQKESTEFNLDVQTNIKAGHWHDDHRDRDRHDHWRR
jgi:hypothetical protein